MLDATLKTQLSAYLEKLQQPIELVASLDDSDASHELDELLGEITALSPHITRVSGNAARKLEPAVAISTSEIVAFKRDYEERTAEPAEEAAGEIAEEASQGITALFSDKAAAEAASAKADAKKLEAERRMRSIAQGYTGNMCSECQNFTMVRNGTCEKCDTCGATSGCS